MRNAPVIALIVAAMTAGCQRPQPAKAPVTAPAAGTAAARSAALIIAEFQTHPIVFLGETHQSADFYAFAKQLVASPGFAGAVNDIVIESGNVRFQPLLDRYVAGEDVPEDSLRLVWRETTQLLVWDSPLYRDFIDFVRARNQLLPLEQRFRVLAGDPPVDWAGVRTAADFPRSFGYRDWQMVDVIQQEVLDRRRRALVIVGEAHVSRRGPGPDSLQPPADRANVADALNRRHPSLAYSIATVVGDVLPALAARVAPTASPGELLPLRGTALGAENAMLLVGPNITVFRNVNGRRVAITLQPSDMPTLETTLDALLYLGPRDHKVPADASVFRDDPAYLAEVRRRIEILRQVYGADIWSDDLAQMADR